MEKYKLALRSLLFSLGGRRFVLTVLGATLAPYLQAKGVNSDLILMLCGLIAAFVLGESFRDGMDSMHKDTIIDGNLQVTSNRTRYEAPSDAQASPVAQAVQAAKAANVANPGPDSKPNALGFRATRAQRGEL